MTEGVAGSEASPPSRLRAVAPILFLCIIMLGGMAASIGMAFNIEAVAMRFGGTTSAYGRLATAELLAIAAGTLAGSRLAGALGARTLALAGMGLAVAANAASLLAPSIYPLMGIRVLAGLGSGAVIAVVMFMAGRSDRPNVLFGALNSSVGVLGILLSTTLPVLVAGHDITGAYGLYTGLAVLSLLFIVSLPGRAAAAADAATGRKPPSLGIGQWLPLLGLGVVFLGHSALAIFIVRIGTGTGTPLASLMPVFVAISALSIVLPLRAVIYGVRAPAAVFAVVVLALLAVSANVLANARDLTTFIAGCGLYAVLPTALMPVVLTAFARHDPSGRLAAANPAFITVGGAVAPSISGELIDIGGYPLVAWMSTGCFVLGGLLLIGTLHAVDRAKRAEF